ncbi:MAG: SH3 domain-containing protein [Nitrospinota bacterium]|nr:MAG: SH3 domain-containing protein [Nitrospinota bacterium]
MNRWITCAGVIAVLLLWGVLPVFSLSAQLLASGVAIRTGPGPDYPLLQVADLLGRFPVLEQQGEWVRLRLAGGSTGWIHTRWITAFIEDERQKAEGYTTWPPGWHLWLEIPFPGGQQP